MDWTIISDFIPSLLTGLAAIGSIVLNNKLIEYRLGEVEKSMVEHNKHLENLISVQTDIANIKEDVLEFKQKEESDRSEIHNSLENLKNDVMDVKGQVNKLQISVTRLEGEINSVKILISAHHNEL